MGLVSAEKNIIMREKGTSSPYFFWRRTSQIASACNCRVLRTRLFEQEQPWIGQAAARGTAGEDDSQGYLPAQRTCPISRLCVQQTLRELCVFVLLATTSG